MILRPIDHLVLPVTTLTLARSRLAALGFNVAADAAHPFGTGNCCVFFRNGTYLEPITFIDRDAADIAAAEGLFFVKRLKRFTERRGEGFCMTALSTDDAESDHKAFRKAGIGEGEPFRFARKATLPDGSEKEIGVVLAATESPAAPDATFFTCQRIGTEALFGPEQTTHANGAIGIVGVAAVAEGPADFHILLSEATGQRELRTTSFGVEAEVGASRIAILTPEGFRARYGIDAPVTHGGLVFAAFDLDSQDAGRAAGYAGAGVIDMPDRLVVPPSPGLGAVLAYRKAANA